MDATRFDAITRFFAARLGRRGFIRGALLSLVGGVSFKPSIGAGSVLGPPPSADCDGDGIAESLITVDNCGFCGNCCLNLGYLSPDCCFYGCTDLAYDPLACGVCFISCPGVLPGCCLGACFDFHDDPSNCGGCGIVCPSGSCFAGVCATPASPCPPDLTLCDGVCVDTAWDYANCGDCGIGCGSQSGFGMCCFGMCWDGQTFFSNCGACGNDCATYGFASPSCCEGTCVDLASSFFNCGACGQTCGDGQVCVDQQCVISAEPKATAQPTRESTPTSTIDKWSLWSGDSTLAGASLYLRRLTADDDPDAMGLLAVGPTYSQADFTRLATLGANYVDLSHPAIFNEAPPYSLDEPLRKHLDLLVGYAKKADLFAIISVRTGPARSEAAPRSFPVCQAGGCFSGGPFEPTSLPKPSALWSNDDAQQAWIDLWKSTARRFHNNPIVIGYHLLAMPDPPDSDAYRSFLQRLITAIRSVDPLTPILVSAPGSGLPSDLVGFEPLAGDRIVYRCDAFEPARYLRQLPDASSPLTYGGDFDPARDGHSGRFDRAWIAAALTPAVTWAADHRRPVLLGGYGMPRWQPGLEAYLDDLLDLFDLRGLHAGLWAWHPATGPIADDAFNLEHGPDPAVRAISDNPLLDVLKQHWRATDVRP